MKQHELKTWPGVFEDTVTGRKFFEFRKDDRDFEIGDLLKLREWNPETEEYTGREKLATIGYILKSQFGVPEGYAVLGIISPIKWAGIKTRVWQMLQACHNFLNQVDPRDKEGVPMAMTGYLGAGQLDKDILVMLDDLKMPDHVLPEKITVKEILQRYLIARGYDGLAGDECGCLLGDICPCDCMIPYDCQPGMKKNCDECDEWKTDDGCYYYDKGSYCVRAVPVEPVKVNDFGYASCCDGGSQYLKYEDGEWGLDTQGKVVVPDNKLLFCPFCGMPLSEVGIGPYLEKARENWKARELDKIASLLKEKYPDEFGPGKLVSVPAMVELLLEELLEQKSGGKRPGGTGG